MSGYLRFENPDGISVLVESESDDLADRNGVQKAGLRGRLRDGTAVAQESFERVIGKVVEVHARTFVNAIRAIDDPPDEAEISFGLKATGEAGNFVVTKVTGEMNYGVRLVWNAPWRDADTRQDGEQRTDTSQP
ncbi:hypothetical protein STAFG_1091 [Streptomyces afghaniensis 772]|uniref:Trypsin-co-occurring domain-containing protein n=1 Tax=Streptomyces afghaniensis 772 TaxID=1283301 RepID=S4MQN1_9ACTN|nr:CU044_2847 family protein [Streptomyces afghaniensis]EPJ41853.1 hypothetical protein STAFG_1091 [Streptomyces afghaniensis 772]